MDFRLLGPVEVAEDDHPVSLGGLRTRALLALLLVHRNEVLAVHRIIDELWGERPPKTAEQAVRVYVSQLRKALEPDRSAGPPHIVLTQGNGYVLKVDSSQVDVDCFGALRAEGRRLLAAGEADRAAGVLGEALSLWRGSPLQDFAYETFAQPEIARLEELRLATLEDRFDAQLAAGSDSELVADLEQLVEANPLRERLRAQLMLALYRSGRQADALKTYQRARQLLVEELGLEPGETLRQLEVQILQQDPELDRPSPSPLSAETPIRPPRSRRLAILGGAVALLAVAALVGLVIAATTGHSGQRAGVTSLRVALVESGRPNLTNTSPLSIDPITGLRAAAEQLGLQPRILYGGNQEGGFFRKIAAAARTSNLVIVGATPWLMRLSELTRRFPKTRFVVPDSVFDPAASFRGQRNVTGMSFDDRENGYLGGYLAALMTHGKQAVSAVGGIPTQSVLNLIGGFKAGARRARPGIAVFVDYARTFKGQDQNRCETAADRQIEHHSAVVFDVAGDCGVGALQAAGFRDVWGLGVDADLHDFGPQILASVVKRLGNATQIAVTLFASRQLPGGQDLRFDFANNGIGLLGINNGVPLAIRAKVEEVHAILTRRDQARDGGLAARR